MKNLGGQASAAAVEVAMSLGFRNLEPVLLKDGSNAMVHLSPMPVVARVPTTSSLVRKPSEKWLARDLDRASYLTQQGAPVIPPSRDLPPGPHRSSAHTGSMAMTFWTFVDQQGEQPVTAEEAAPALHDLHAAMHDYPGDLPFMGVILEELPHWLHWLDQQHVLSGAEIITLRQAQWEVAGKLHSLRTKMRPLHGDAHHGNLLRTPQGLLWTDFEDACFGPLEWDVAILVSRDPQNADRILASYPAAPGWDELMPFLRARALEAVIYQQVLGRRFPQRSKEASMAMLAWQRQ